MDDQIRVLIADDHTIVRSGIRLLLEAEQDIRVVGEAIDGQEALAIVETTQPDVVLMDITMPMMDGLEATRQIKVLYPHIQVLILTMHRSDDYFFETLKAGASGYILKGAQAKELIEAVRVVGRGEVFLYPAMAQKLVQGYLNLEQWESKNELSLSPREREIMHLLAEGFSSNQIAEKLFISLSTVHTHCSNIMSKLGLSNQRALIKYARKRGLIQ